MKLGKNTLRKMILNEMRSTLIKEDVDPQRFASYIVETYGDMFDSEGYIDSQVENHVYFELIEHGHMTEEAPDFDLLDSVMEHLAVKGIVQEAFPGMGKSGIMMRGKGWRDVGKPKPAREEVEQQQAMVAADVAKMLKDAGMKPALLNVLDRTLTKIVAYESVPASEKRPVSNLIDRLGVGNKKFQRMDYYDAAKVLQRAIKSMTTQQEAQVKESKKRSLSAILFGSKK